jgi:hypothetical protein
MAPRVSFVTLGVADLERSRTFYETLGFKASAASNPHVTFFDAGGVVLALFGRSALAEDAGLRDSHPGFSGIALAYNLAGESDVDQFLVEAVAAGGQLVKPGQDTFWGGYSGYFSDPDGHLWEVAYNPFFPLDDEGRVLIPAPVDHDAYPDAYIDGILKSVRVIAMVGASPRPDRPSFGVMRYLLEKGYEVRPVNPRHAGQEIHGQRVYARLNDVPEPVDMVDIFRNSNAAAEVVQEALAERRRLKLSVIWMQLGVRHDEAATAAGRAGLKVVMDRCPKIELARRG